jgi:hypothetical protein
MTSSPWLLFYLKKAGMVFSVQCGRYKSIPGESALFPVVPRLPVSFFFI